jgi:hypothetical protein
MGKRNDDSTMISEKTDRVSPKLMPKTNKVKSSAKPVLIEKDFKNVRAEKAKKEKTKK